MVHQAVGMTRTLVEVNPTPMEDMVNLAEDTMGVAAATMVAADVGTMVVVDAAPLPMKLHGRASQLRSLQGR